jgi:hypothetical protein
VVPRDREYGEKGDGTYPVPVPNMTPIVEKKTQTKPCSISFGGQYLAIDISIAELTTHGLRLQVSSESHIANPKQPSSHPGEGKHGDTHGSHDIMHHLREIIPCYHSIKGRYEAHSQKKALTA